VSNWETVAMRKFARRFRLPAEWLLTEREENILDFYAELNLLFSILLICGFFVITLFFGNVYSRLILRHPYVTGVMLLIGLAVSYRKLNKRIVGIQNLDKGIDGERIIAAQLESLKANGCRIFNDLQLGGFNVDFAVICPGGVYAVEVKNHSHPPMSTLKYINGVLRLGNQDKNADIRQAKSGGKTVHDLILAGTRKSIFVTPILAYVDVKMDLDFNQVINSENIILTDDASIYSFFAKLPGKLSIEEVETISSFLDQYVAANELNVGKR